MTQHKKLKLITLYDQAHLNKLSRGQVLIYNILFIMGKPIIGRKKEEEEKKKKKGSNN